MQVWLCSISLENYEICKYGFVQFCWLICTNNDSFSRYHASNIVRNVKWNIDLQFLSISTSIKNSRVLQCNQIGFRSYLTTLICILEIGLLKCHSLIIRERVDCSTRMTLDWFIHGPICYFQEFNLSCKSGRLGSLIDWLHFHKLTFRRQNFRANVLLSQFFLVQICDNWCLATTASH